MLAIVPAHQLFPEITIKGKGNFTTIAGLVRANLGGEVDKLSQANLNGVDAGLTAPPSGALAATTCATRCV